MHSILLDHFGEAWHHASWLRRGRQDYCSANNSTCNRIAEGADEGKHQDHQPQINHDGRVVWLVQPADARVV
jgi:hypothetical protein